MIRRRLLLAAFAMTGLTSCGSSSPAGPVSRQAHSNAIAVSPDGSRVFVVHPDADRVSVVDVRARSIEHEVALAAAPPSVDPSTQRYDPAVMPRALALDSSGKSLYVTGQRSGSLYAIDTQAAAIRKSAAVCAEPVGVLVSPDDSRVFVACAQDDEVIELDAGSLSVVARASTPRKPWALAWTSDGETLLVTHLLGPGVSALAVHPLAVKATWTVPDVGPRADSTEPHGQVRGIYDVAPRPGSDELWVAHLMLGTDTPQPALVFDNTVFPAVSVLGGEGEPLARLSVQGSHDARPDNGAFGDVVSGPHAVAFSDDGRLAFVVDTSSEDLLVIDAARRVEATVVRPLPGHMPEGVVVFGDEVYVQERNTEDVAAFKVKQGPGGLSVTADGAPIKSLASDPMPPTLRLGQKLFFSANSDDLPITQNHWVACATCHIEGRSDAVTWRFEQGPRDTPTNAGGMLQTGFLFRTADRSRVQDYWKTIDVEQGGFFHPGGSQEPLLDAVAAFVNYALPVPVPPSTDPALRAQGEAVFERVGCAACHNGPAKTDSGNGNPTLDLEGRVLLHDVGTCVTGGPWPDVAHTALDGEPRAACAFDTPALRGLWDSAPYLHDGSAATLDDVLAVMLQAVAGPGAPAPTLGADGRKALLEYLRSL
jgi:DNA-binding beta-propeller fold protein YncE/mono/diheme cytochrome c family protein